MKRDTRREREAAQMTASSMKAMNTPEGEEILRQMVDKEIAISDGIVKLLLLSGDYEPREDTEGGP
jgi:hypothetical protein